MNKSFYGAGVIGVALIAFAFFGASASGQKAEPKKVDHMEHNEMMQACSKACSECQRACDTCATHCTHMLQEGKKDHLATAMACQDCASICSVSSQIMARGGPFSDTVCTACAEACSRCGKECEKFPDDKHMKQCAEECRKCEKSCRDMLKHMGK
ncbi:hypothetical protein BH11PLA2_BH11PLA2_47010 [soil metagenome]